MNDVLQDIRKRFPDFPKTMVFDVGGNIGQTVKQLVQGGVTCPIWSFEISSPTFKILEKNTEDFANVSVFELGFSDTSKSVFVTDLEHSVNNHIVNSSSRHKKTKGYITTGESFCRDNKVDYIDLLKIDTEGHDLKVAKGFEGMMQKGKIGFVILEIAMNPTNLKHVSLSESVSFMEDKGFFIYGIYDQVLEARRNYMRRSNILFTKAEKIR